MTVKKVRGRWLADFHPVRGIRKRKTFDFKKEAESWLVGETNTYNTDPESLLRKKDTRALSELVLLWFDLHGHSLKEGEHRRAALLRTCAGLGDPPAYQFKGKLFSHYRQQRAKVVTLNTVNHEHSYLRAVFNELARMGEWVGQNPLSGLKLYKIPPTDLTYLEPAQIEILQVELGDSLNRYALPVALVCLATGARWSEAETLTRSQVKNNQITFTQTKGNKPRSIPIDPNFAKYILSSRGEGDRLFGPCYDAFSNALKRSGIKLPRGQRSHVLRHTYASNFIQKGGSIAVLQKILGHATIAMTMRYSHLAPDHLADAIKFNPVGHIVDTLSNKPALKIVK